MLFRALRSVRKDEHPDDCHALRPITVRQSRRDEIFIEPRRFLKFRAPAERNVNASRDISLLRSWSDLLSLQSINISPLRGWARFRFFSFVASLLVVFLCTIDSANAQSTQEGQALFGAKCFSCHNIGGGDKTGPDLKGVTSRRTKDWLHEYILSPAAVKDKGDPVAADLFRKFPAVVMPDQALTRQQIDSILALIDELTSKNQPFIPAGAKLSRAIMSGDVDGGWQLFMGRARLQNGGTSCISCHSIKDVGVFGGGTLGPDLTAVNIKYRDPELISILQNPNFPTMSTVFATHQLTNEEIVKLFALFQDSKLRNPVPPAQAGVIQLDPKFFVMGVVAMLLVLTLLHLAWRKRLHGVREELVRRATR